MSIIIRRAGRRDLEGIQVLWHALRELQAKADPRLTLSKDAAQIAREHREVILADPRTGFFVAEEQSVILGFLHAHIEANDPNYDPPKLGRIVDLIVREDRRGKCIGTRLLAYCREWLTSHGLSEVRVTLPINSPEAQRFFEAQGMLPLEVTHRAGL
jgi:GNAT superfamily N-acetyltransferase